VPLTIQIPGREFFDPSTDRFMTVKPTVLTLEHSLLSISKWEAKWHKPYLAKNEKTNEESLDYVRCMCLSKDVDPEALHALTKQNIMDISEYISDPMTATTIKRMNQRSSREVVTNELIYFWMTNFQIPFDPCEKWHLNRLMTLIEIASIKNQPSKKMPKREWANQRAALNAQRKARYNTRG